MGNEFQSKSIGPMGGGEPGTSEVGSLLEDLERRFAQFRGEHTRGARIPEDLRAAAVSALLKGVVAGAIERTCGVSWNQLHAWKGGQRSVAARRASRGAKSRPGARVFSVVDDPVDRGAPPMSASNELELRLGPWSVRVRLTDPMRTEWR
jgi:hypothetical protein